MYYYTEEIKKQNRRKKFNEFFYELEKLVIKIKITRKGKPSTLAFKIRQKLFIGLAVLWQLLALQPVNSRSSEGWLSPLLQQNQVVETINVSKYISQIPSNIKEAPFSLVLKETKPKIKFLESPIPIPNQLLELKNMQNLCDYQIYRECMSRIPMRIL